MVKITDVAKGSRADRHGVCAGDMLCSINGRDIADVLDYRFFLADTEVKLGLLRDGRPLEVTIRKREYDDIGLDFETPLMDRKHSCENKCIFCFIDQLPKGMRETLYFKDDDSRLSFLHGNFITMTNLRDPDIRRIMDMHISPINVSVHTTNPELRVKMMKNPRAATTLPYLRRLTDAGITVNTQIVLCPGWNDGPELRRTLEDLCALGENMRGVAVVPIGLTDHREGLEPMRVFTPAEAAAAIDLIEEFGDRLAAQRGERVVHPSDEFFLLAGRPIPPPEYYDGFTQLEDGVGMIAALDEEFGFALEDTPAEPTGRRVSIVSGTAAAPFMQQLCARAEGQFPGLWARVWPVENRLLGKNITVTGLLCGKDIAEALAGEDLGEELLISESMLRREGDLLLDDTTPQWLSEQLGVAVRAVPFGGQPLLDAILGR